MLDTPTKRVRAGFSLATVVLVVILGSLLISALDALHAYVLPILSGFGLLGVVLLLVGHQKNCSSDAPEVTSQEKGVIEAEHPLAFLGNFTYWGWVVIISTVPILCLCHLLMQPEETIKQRTKPRVKTKVVQPPPPAPVAKLVVAFPDLKLTGLVCNGTMSTAVINGSTIRVGQSVEAVTLVAVETWGVVVEMNGVKKVIPLGS